MLGHISSRWWPVCFCCRYTAFSACSSCK